MKKVDYSSDEKLRKSEREMIEFTNGMLQQFTTDKSLMKLIGSELKSDDKFKLYQLSMKVLKSAEMEAYIKTKNEVVEKYQEDQAKTKAEVKVDTESNIASETSGGEAIEASTSDLPSKPVDESEGMPVDHPEILNLFKQETTLIVAKPRIKAASLDKSISVADMIQLAWLVEFLG